METRYSMKKSNGVRKGSDNSEKEELGVGWQLERKCLTGLLLASVISWVFKGTLYLAKCFY